ncbi:ImmA/IrrE family metallo-endopeptidase [Kribbella sp. NPDC056861]|uniref:ImmA/IrrE family metallo-endopeptidase n=1 Tax=Kribbella sp. NPDC056861 TaxID=3154857 RepID=UPI0034350CBB
MNGPRRDIVALQAANMVAVAKRIFGTDFGELHREPCDVLGRWDQIQLQFVLEVPAEGKAACSVAGAYIEDDQGVSTIQVALAASPRRRNFTALHELGHHLQRTDSGLAKAVWGQTPRALFEDVACDGFAAAILLPDAVVELAINQSGPTAGDLVTLYRRCSASRSAVCVQGARRLPAPGHVALLHPDGTVFFSSSRELPPLRRGSDQSGTPVIGRALSSGNGRGRGRFTYRDGIQGQELYIQTTGMDGFLLVVAVTDHAPWEEFALPSRDDRPRAGSYDCVNPACGTSYTTFAAGCSRCRVPPCPDCGRCACEPALAERTCTSCWMVKPAAGFARGVCADCL